MIQGVIQWILRTFLGGLFQKTTQKIEDDAQHKVDAVQAQAASQHEADTAQTQVVQAEADAKARVDGAVKTPDDPFGDKDWNSK